MTQRQVKIRAHSITDGCRLQRHFNDWRGIRRYWV